VFLCFGGKNDFISFLLLTLIKFLTIAPPRLQRRGLCFELATRFRIFVTIELFSNDIVFIVTND